MSAPFMALAKFELEQGLIDRAEFLRRYKKGLLMLKEGTKCRQFDTIDSSNKTIFALHLREFNDALGSKKVSAKEVVNPMEITF